MNEPTKTPACIVCGGETHLCLDLGKQPLANALLSRHDDKYRAFPLGLASCSQCSHGQLSYFVPPSELFQNYLYASGTGRALHPYFTWFAAALAKGLKPGASVFEVACNDGSLLDSLRECGLEACGVDPAANLTEVARAKEHNVLTGFFPQCRPPGQFDAIVAMNVCAHTPEPRALMRGVKDLLAPGGAAFIQTSQAFMLLNGEFDTIYHEHYSFYTPASFKRLAEDCGLQIEARKIVTVHGGSLLHILRHEGERAETFGFAGGASFEAPWPSPEPSILSARLTGDEAAAGYRKFSERAQDVMSRARDRIKSEQGKGTPVALVGVAAKALTFINAAGIRPDFYLDEAPLKVARFVPGSARAIQPLNAASALPEDTLFVIGAWNFADELSAKVRACRQDLSSRFLVCLPELREFN